MNLPDLKTFLLDNYSLAVESIEFLPIGADQNTFVYRAIGIDGTPYFLKLRSGDFNGLSVILPRYLSDQGIQQVIPPLTTIKGELWSQIDTSTAVLYPYIEGNNAYEVPLTDAHWMDLGTAVNRIHTMKLPEYITGHLHQETYSSQWRKMAKMFISRLEKEDSDDPAARELIDFLKTKRDVILDMVKHAEALASLLKDQPEEFVLCHSDIHAGNILMDANNKLYIVDWDDPILAPKERDLMYIGGGLMGNHRPPDEEVNLFYKTYHYSHINHTAMAYYRFERIIVDIALYCEEILLTNESQDDKQLALRYLMSNFQPGGTIEIAYNSRNT